MGTTTDADTPDPRAPLAGTVAVVTGASRGIGKGCAIELAAAGATVYVTARTLHAAESSRVASLEATIEEIAARGGRAVAVRCDHANDDDVDGLFARVRDEHGRLDVLVNNAFRPAPHRDPRVPFWETPIADWDALIDVGTRSAYTGTHHAARMMVDARRGLVVNVSSAGAIRYFHHLVYGIGKEALDRLTRDAARPLAPHGVAIVSIWPYLVRTETVLSMPGIDDTITESTRFSGRAIVALASDPDVLACTGRAFTTRALADRYGFVDVDGRLPPHQPWAPPE
ncbi:MAG: SDR family NAD(P)-dependent oxidoreductase [Acidimicrobiia bacterium]|jgi:dehydrogenase/reductase SDR family protein 1